MAVGRWRRGCRQAATIAQSVRKAQADHLVRMQALKALEKQLHRTLVNST